MHSSVDDAFGKRKEEEIVGQFVLGAACAALFISSTTHLSIYHYHLLYG
jgi:hypothetical protein